MPFLTSPRHRHTTTTTSPYPPQLPSRAGKAQKQQVHLPPQHTPQQWRVCTPAHPIHHNNAKSWLILDVIIPCDKQAKGQAVVSTVNSLLSYGPYRSRIDAILYSKRDRPIMITSKGHNTESLRSKAHLMCNGLFEEPAPDQPEDAVMKPSVSCL